MYTTAARSLCVRGPLWTSPPGVMAERRGEGAMHNGGLDTCVQQNRQVSRPPGGGCL